LDPSKKRGQNSLKTEAKSINWVFSVRKNHASLGTPKLPVFDHIETYLHKNAHEIHHFKQYFDYFLKENYFFNLFLQIISEI